MKRAQCSSLRRPATISAQNATHSCTVASSANSWSSRSCSAARTISRSPRSIRTNAAVVRSGPTGWAPATRASTRGPRSASVPRSRLMASVVVERYATASGTPSCSSWRDERVRALLGAGHVAIDHAAHRLVEASHRHPHGADLGTERRHGVDRPVERDPVTEVQRRVGEVSEDPPSHRGRHRRGVVEHGARFVGLPLQHRSGGPDVRGRPCRGDELHPLDERELGQQHLTLLEGPASTGRSRSKMSSFANSPSRAARCHVSSDDIDNASRSSSHPLRIGRIARTEAVPRPHAQCPHRGRRILGIDCGSSGVQRVQTSFGRHARHRLGLGESHEHSATLRRPVAIVVGHELERSTDPSSGVLVGATVCGQLRARTVNSIARPRSPPMVASVQCAARSGSDVVERTGVASLERQRHLAMLATAPARREFGVERLAHEPMGEPVPVGPHVDQQVRRVAASSASSTPSTPTPEHVGEQGDVELEADHRGRAQDLLDHFAESVEPLADDLADPLGDPGLLRPATRSSTDRHVGPASRSR